MTRFNKLDLSWQDTFHTRFTGLENSTVFITGGASGIGAVLVAAFAQQNAHVFFVDLATMTDAARELIAALREKGFRVPEFIACDLRETTAYQAVIERVITCAGSIDILINNAADDQRMDTLTLNSEAWLNSFAINLHPIFFAAQAVQPAMAKKGGGVILNMSSVNTLWAPPQLAGYVTAKAGVLGLTKSLARDFGEFNIRVNAISPGWVATPKQLEKWLTKEEEAELMNRVCLKRRLDAQEVAKLALFLASDDARMITAQDFTIDGGRF